MFFVEDVIEDMALTENMEINNAIKDRSMGEGLNE